MNRISVNGYLGRNAEVKQSKSNEPYAQFSVASTHRKNKDDKEGITTWFNVVAFGRTADGCRKLEKGEHVHVDGRMQEEEYTSKEGEKKKSWKLIAQNVSIDVTPRAAAQVQQQEATMDEIPF